MTAIDTIEFIRHCRVQRSLSENTVRAYQQDLNAFVRFSSRHEQDLQVTEETVVTYTAWLREEGELGAATVRRRLVTLRAFYAWLLKTQRIDRSPFDGLTLELRTPRRLPRPIDRPTLSELFKQSRRINPAAADPCSVGVCPAVDSRQVTGLVARLLISTGLRIGEITRVRICDVSSGGTCIRVRGKGDRERSVYVTNTHLLEDLNSYLDVRRALAEPQHHVFLNSRGTRLTEAAFRKRLRSMSAELRITPHLTPHRFRHSAATLLIEEGVDIRVVQRLLGHASIATTEIYTKVSDTSLISAIKAADTLAKVDS
ncbi:MAG: tyrosine-type recombinase/integrase [Pseudomonadota bacterium]